MLFLTKTEKETAQFVTVIAAALAAAALVISQPASANDYQSALSNSQSECRAALGSDSDPAAHRRCVEITMHDTYGFGTPTDPQQTQNIPLESTPWGVYREPAEVDNAFQLQQQ